MEISSMTTEFIKKLAGNRCLLIGFDSAEAGRIAQALDQAQAFSRVLKPSDVQADGGGLPPFDVLILNATLGPDAFPWLGSETFSKDRPLLLVGSSRLLMAWTVKVADFASDFLLDPWSPEEVCLRVYQLLSSNKQRNSAPQPDTKKTPSILIADDDLTTIVLVKAAIEGSDMNCQVATDGQEALEMTREHHPNAIILDVNMPGLDGYEVLASLKNDQKTSAIPTILLTSYQQEVDILRGFSLGADDYIVKPFNPIEMVARLRRLLPK